ncbi:hypothetical protein ERJ75_001419400 [Trypanosoma vivax]|uniref:Uncharacterized protein n=1 Tax=Trypanosoma vivax (strain Y486) TaxID=1055687 RepID=G0TUJ8_TRYVY|nr:hypothetical protein TRVL_03705 [Trypanosoma vivax]KAH8607376.1 hypothetical protein ERJ75_001419400 [Trypanosoma vivax]CCC47632.1 conserved hypothetical protein [Trypanosoma vivax Y486]
MFHSSVPESVSDTGDNNESSQTIATRSFVPTGRPPVVPRSANDELEKDRPLKNRSHQRQSSSQSDTDFSEPSLKFWLTPVGSVGNSNSVCEDDAVESADDKVDERMRPSSIPSSSKTRFTESIQGSTSTDLHDNSFEDNKAQQALVDMMITRELENMIFMEDIQSVVDVSISDMTASPKSLESSRSHLECNSLGERRFGMMAENEPESLTEETDQRTEEASQKPVDVVDSTDVQSLALTEDKSKSDRDITEATSRSGSADEGRGVGSQSSRSKEMEECEGALTIPRPQDVGIAVLTVDSGVDPKDFFLNEFLHEPQGVLGNCEDLPVELYPRLPISCHMTRNDCSHAHGAAERAETTRNVDTVDGISKWPVMFHRAHSSTRISYSEMPLAQSHKSRHSAQNLVGNTRSSNSPLLSITGNKHREEKSEITASSRGTSLTNHFGLTCARKDNVPRSKLDDTTSKTAGRTKKRMSTSSSRQLPQKRVAARPVDVKEVNQVPALWREVLRNDVLGGSSLGSGANQLFPGVFLSHGRSVAEPQCTNNVGTLGGEGDVEALPTPIRRTEVVPPTKPREARRRINHPSVVCVPVPRKGNHKNRPVEIQKATEETPPILLPVDAPERPKNIEEINTFEGDALLAENSTGRREAALRGIDSLGQRGSEQREGENVDVDELKSQSSTCASTPTTTKNTCAANSPRASEKSHQPITGYDTAEEEYTMRINQKGSEVYRAKKSKYLSPTPELVDEECSSPEAQRPRANSAYSRPHYTETLLFSRLTCLGRTETEPDKRRSYWKEGTRKLSPPTKMDPAPKPAMEEGLIRSPKRSLHSPSNTGHSWTSSSDRGAYHYGNYSPWEDNIVENDVWIHNRAAMKTFARELDSITSAVRGSYLFRAI